MMTKADLPRGSPRCCHLLSLSHIAHYGRTIILRSHSIPRHTGVVCRHALRPAAHLTELRQDASERSYIKTFARKPSTYAAPWVTCYAQRIG